MLPAGTVETISRAYTRGGLAAGGQRGARAPEELP